MVSDLTALRLRNTPVRLVDDFRFLGANFGFHCSRPIDEHDALLTEVVVQVKACFSLPGPAWGSAEVRPAVAKRDGRCPELGLRPGRFPPGGGTKVVPRALGKVAVVGVGTGRRRGHRRLDFSCLGCLVHFTGSFA